MGYELSIQREENQIKLTKKDWIDYIKSDSEFEQIDEFSAEIDDGKFLTVPTPNAGLWKTEKGEVPFTFDEEYGWISVKNPDERIIKKMISIAHNLDSIVLGEEGEKYNEKNLLGKQPTNEYKSKDRKWWQFWKSDKPKVDYPISLDSDLDNDLFLGDCFCSSNKEFGIGLMLFEIHQGQGSKYYSFAPVLLNEKKSAMDRFIYGQIKFQPNLGSRTYEIPAIGIINEQDLKELKKYYHKEGKLDFKKSAPKCTGTSYLLGLTEEHLTEFVEQLEYYFTEKERKIVPVLKLIK